MIQESQRLHAFVHFCRTVLIHRCRACLRPHRAKRWLLEQPGHVRNPTCPQHKSAVGEAVYITHTVRSPLYGGYSPRACASPRGLLSPAGGHLLVVVPIAAFILLLYRAAFGMLDSDWARYGSAQRFELPLHSRSSPTVLPSLGTLGSARLIAI